MSSPFCSVLINDSDNCIDFYDISSFLQFLLNYLSHISYFAIFEKFIENKFMKNDSFLSGIVGDD